MLYVGLDLSRKRLDWRALDESGGDVAAGASPPDRDGLAQLARRLGDAEVLAVIESMTGARFVHDQLELYGWDVRIGVSTITTLPAELGRSLTWDRGKEMAKHADLKIAAGLSIYFCDPQSPWQRGTNENTNGLLRQYFPKGTDLSRHSADDLAAVAATLNSRPRKTSTGGRRLKH